MVGKSNIFGKYEKCRKWWQNDVFDGLPPHLWEQRVRPAVLPVDANREADLAVSWAGRPAYGDHLLRYPVGLTHIAVVVDGHAMATDVGRGLRKCFREHAEAEAIHSCRRETAVRRVRADLAAIYLALNELRAVQLPQSLALVWAALDRYGLGSTRLAWVGMDWVGVGWIRLDLFGLV